MSASTGKRSHKFAARTSEGRKRQLANLDPYNAALKSGAYSAARREGASRESRRAFASGTTRASDDLIGIVARREALITLFGAHVADRGPVRRSGKVEPAARELRLLLDAQERSITELEQRRRAAQRPTATALEEHIAANYPADNGDGS